MSGVFPPIVHQNFKIFFGLRKIISVGQHYDLTWIPLAVCAHAGTLPYFTFFLSWTHFGPHGHHMAKSACNRLRLDSEMQVF